MRRKDREVTSPDDIRAILSKAMVCRLAMIDPDHPAPYIVPLNYGYEYQGGKLRLVFHCAKEGRKLDIINQNPNVGFELDCSHGAVEAVTACGYSFTFASIIGTGTAKIISDPLEQVKAVDLLMLNIAGQTLPIEENMLRQTTFFEVLVDEFTAKQKLR